MDFLELNQYACILYVHKVKFLTCSYNKDYGNMSSVNKDIYTFIFETGMASIIS